MKILLITSFFPPTNNAGTEKRTFGYAKQLQKLGHEVQVICAGDFDTGDQYWNGFQDEEFQGIDVRRINLNWSLAPDANQYLYKNPLTAEKIKNWTAAINPDLVHITSCYSLSASIIEAIQNLKIPVVLTLTDFWFICPKHTLLRYDESLCDGRTSNWECVDCMLAGNDVYQKLRPFLTKKAGAAGFEWVSQQPAISNLRGFRGMALNMGERKEYLERMITLPEAVIAPSRYLREVFVASGTAREIRVVPSGHDLTWMQTSIERDPGGQINFGFIGQITPIKGLHLLIQAFNNEFLMEKSNLYIYGPFESESTYQDSIQRSINGHGGSVFLQGSFPHEKLGEILSEIDILVVPSLWHENNPRVIQEAFAASTPVIASDVGGMSEFVFHDSNGLLFERNNEIDLTRQLTRIVDEPELLDKLKKGIQPVKTIETEVDELVVIYQEFI